MTKIVVPQPYARERLDLVMILTSVNMRHRQKSRAYISAEEEKAYGAVLTCIRYNSRIRGMAAWIARFGYDADRDSVESWSRLLALCTSGRKRFCKWK